MQHEVKKVTLIMNELMNLMLRNGADNIDINIKRHGDISEVTLIQRQCKYPEDMVESIRYDLNTQRQCEMEGYYWQLVGDDEPSEELHLVGAMIDEAVVEMRNNDLYIHITRSEKRC